MVYIIHYVHYSEPKCTSVFLEKSVQILDENINLPSRFKHRKSIFLKLLFLKHILCSNYCRNCSLFSLIDQDMAVKQEVHFHDKYFPQTSCLKRSMYDSSFRTEIITLNKS